MNLTDAVFLLAHLFLGGPEPICLDAADADDNEAINVTDAVYILNHLFRSGPEPPPPGPAEANCGLDPEGKRLGCAAYTSCC